MSSSDPLFSADSRKGHGRKTKNYMSVENSRKEDGEEEENRSNKNTFLRQMRAMLKKNVVLQKRFIAGTICEFLFPIILILVSCLYVLLFKSALDVDAASSYSKSNFYFNILITILIHFSRSLP